VDLAFNSVVFPTYVTRCVLSSAPVMDFAVLLGYCWSVKQLKCFPSATKIDLLTRGACLPKPYTKLSWKSPWHYTRYIWIRNNLSSLKILLCSAGLHCYKVLRVNAALRYANALWSLMVARSVVLWLLQWCFAQIYCFIKTPHNEQVYFLVSNLRVLA